MTEPIIKRQQAATARLVKTRRLLPAAEQRLAELEGQAGAAMLEHGAIPPAVDEEISKQQRMISAVRNAVVIGEEAVRQAEREDAAEEQALGREQLLALTSSREVLAEKIAALFADSLSGLVQELHQVERDIFQIVGARATLAADGLHVNPVTDALMSTEGVTHRLNMLAKTTLPGWHYANYPPRGFNFAAETRRESGLLLDFFNAAPPRTVSDRVAAAVAAAPEE